jgi:two-component system response regulator FixJ
MGNFAAFDFRLAWRLNNKNALGLKRPGYPATSTASEVGKPVSKATVFVIDDDEACRDSVRELVSAAGLAVAVFSSAAEFLTAFDPAWHGCLVLDLRMPRMNGRALQERLLELGILMPIVFISGSVDTPTAVQAIKDGAVDFLQKPYPENKLLDAIYKGLRRNAS